MCALAVQPAQGIMQHPWMTQLGFMRMCMRRLMLPWSIEVPHQSCSTIIDNTALVSTLHARLEERMFAPGEYLYR